MRHAVEALTRRWWAGELGATGRLLTALTLPLSWTWSAVAGSVGAHRAARAVRLDGLSVISVGNLAVGGTGKTPVTGWIAAHLRSDGLATAILVGGHGRDEARLHARRLPEVCVVEDRNRVAGGRAARRRGAWVAIMDDGFQHRGLLRDLDVVLLAAEDPFPGPVLPSGPYREPASALARADLAIVTRRSASADAGRRLASRVEEVAPALVVGGVELAPEGWRTLDGAPSEGPRHGDVLAVCGVARPEAFRSQVERVLGRSVELVAFADHHDYTPADIDRLRRRSRGRPLAITEKDAVKLRHHSGTLGESYVLAERLSWDWGRDTVLARVRVAVAQAAVR